MPFPLSETLLRCASLLPEPFRSDHARLWQPEHLEALAGRLLRFAEEGVPDSPPPPHFAAECTPPLGPAFAPFRDILARWLTRPDPEAEPTAEERRDWSAALATAGCASILLLLGQRLTPASVTDARGIPPTRAELLAAADAPCAPGVKLSVAGRAWAKHAPRSDSGFWGTPRGGDAEKNAEARRLVEGILGGATWWNVFGHYLHGTVYEARLPGGHGARWSGDGRTFVGFLEPFLDAEELRVDG